MNKFIYIFGIIFSTNAPQDIFFRDGPFAEYKRVVANTVYCPIFSLNGNNQPNIGLSGRIGNVTIAATYEANRNSALYSGITHTLAYGTEVSFLTSMELNKQIFQIMFRTNGYTQIGLRISREDRNLKIGFILAVYADATTINNLNIQDITQFNC